MNVSSSNAEPVIFRTAYLREITSNDEALFRKFVEVFLKNCPVLIKRITDSHENKDRDGLFRAAHTLNGSAGSFGAERLRAAAAELEIASREQDYERLPALVDRVLAEWGQLQTEVRRILDG